MPYSQTIARRVRSLFDIVEAPVVMLPGKFLAMRRPSESKSGRASIPSCSVTIPSGIVRHTQRHARGMMVTLCTGSAFGTFNLRACDPLVTPSAFLRRDDHRLRSAPIRTVLGQREVGIAQPSCCSVPRSAHARSRGRQVRAVNRACARDDRIRRLRRGESCGVNFRMPYGRAHRVLIRRTPIKSPGRSSAGSSTSGRWSKRSDHSSFDSNPSSTSNDQVCSRSSCPPPRPAPR